MNVRVALVVLTLALAGCDQLTASKQGEGAENAPQLDAPAPESEPSRVFATANDAARTATGALTVGVSMQLPEAAGGETQEVLTLSGENGLRVEAQVTSAVSPATQVQGQTLRALLSIPVEAAQVLVYRVTEETKPSSGQGLCGGDNADFVVVWEPGEPGEPVLKVLGVTGGAPGAEGARPCTLLDYRRA